MLRETDALLCLAPANASAVLNNALLESYLTHLRNLWDFLTNKGAWSDDVLARLYNENDSWCPANVPTGLKAISKKVAHITTARSTKESFEIPALTQQTRESFAHFVRTVTPGRKHWFDWFVPPQA